MKLRERARSNFVEKARNLLACRGVEKTPRALAGAIDEVEYRERIMAFLGGING